MIYTRAKLIEMIEQRIMAANDKAEANYKKFIEQYEADRKAWVEKYGNEWREFCGRVVSTLDHGEPIETNLKPKTWKDGWASVPFYSNSKPEFRPADTSNLKRMLQIIQDVEDEKISTSALERMGVKVRELYG
jgi:hypothetical protein